MAHEVSVEELRDRYGLGERSLADRIRRNWVGYVLILPVMVAFSLLFYVPLLRGIWMSFLDDVIVQQTTWVGLDNYLWMVTNDLFVYALVWTIVYALSATFLQVSIGLGVALLTNELTTGRREWASAILFSPYFGAAVAAGIILKFFLNPTYGAIGRLFMVLGLDPINFLTEGIWPFFSLIVGNSWHDYAYAAIIYVAALQGIPSDQYEAAAIDGASRIQRFRTVTVPHLLTPTIIVLALRTAFMFAEFVIPFEMTGGGPGTRTMVLSILTYRTAYVTLDFGRAAAMGNVLIVLSVSMAIFYIFVIREEEELYL